MHKDGTIRKPPQGLVSNLPPVEEGLALSLGQDQGGRLGVGVVLEELEAAPLPVSADVDLSQGPKLLV